MHQYGMIPRTESVQINQSDPLKYLPKTYITFAKCKYPRHIPAIYKQINQVGMLIAKSVLNTALFLLTL
jgi:Mg2+/Co2+ transporter CorC